MINPAPIASIASIVAEQQKAKAEYELAIVTYYNGTVHSSDSGNYKLGVVKNSSMSREEFNALLKDYIKTHCYTHIADGVSGVDVTVVSLRDNVTGDVLFSHSINKEI